MIRPDADVIVVAASDGYELAAAGLLASVGLRVRGFLVGGMTAWRSERRPVSRLELIDPDELGTRLDSGEALTRPRRTRQLGVRGRPHSGSVNIPYGELADRLGELPDGPVATICSGGRRSGLAASILQREGSRR